VTLPPDVAAGRLAARLLTVIPRQTVVVSCLALVGLLVPAACGGDVESADGVATTTPSVIPLDVLASVGPVSPPGATGDLEVVEVRPETVAVVGDSLALSAEEDIWGLLRANSVDVVGFDAQENRRTNRSLDDLTSGVEAVTELQATLDPDLWVIALGTNDVGGQESADELRADVDELLALIPPGVPVIWVDVWIESRVDSSIEANDVLRAAAAARPGMSVINWFQYGDDPGIINDDGVHLSIDGQAKFAKAIADEVVARFGPA
jgi:lysophospholipase L1-like esterase